MSDDLKLENSGAFGVKLPVGEIVSAAQEAHIEELPRSRSKIGRETFTAILEMTSSQPWLKERQNPLIELIDECETHDQQKLVFDLLERFTFIDARMFQDSIQAIADYIQNTLGLDAKSAAISASENGWHSDSSQFIAYSLKSAKWNSLNWNTTSFVSNLTHLVSSAGKSNLVLVDEFIGTGETAEKKIKWLRAQLQNTGLSPNIYFACIAGMKDGVDRVKKIVNGVCCTHIIEKGISGFYPAAEAAQRIDSMLSLEKNLYREGRRGLLKNHSLGYKKTEALYSRANGNTPNNVFPVFWWELRSDKSQRLTLLSCI